MSLLDNASGPWGRFVLKPRFTPPAPRSTNGLHVALRRLWTLPTDTVGHLVGWALTGGPPRPVGGTVAKGYLYTLSGAKVARFVGAIALGHVILCRTDLLEGPMARALLAHELAHTRQHDWLGPLYLPAHGLAQLISLAFSYLLPGKVPSRVHAYNPLEQTFICLGATNVRALAAGELTSHDEQEAFYRLFGL